ncbi:MAG: vitamin K epoxide reductase family protein [Nannocystaceae bacterium]
MDAPAAPAFARKPAVVLALLGLLTSGALQVLHVRTYLFPTADSVCHVGETFDCNAVTLSRFSVVLGVPLPALGALGFYGLMLLAGRSARLLLPLSAIAAAASLALLAEELLHVGAICMFCEAVHVLALALFVLVWRQRDRLVPTERRDWIGAVAVPLVLALGVRLFAPSYWAGVLWTRAIDVPTGVDEQGFPWIGAPSPTLTVHEYTDYACPHCRIATARMHGLVAKHAERLRIVRHQQPRLHCSDFAMSGCVMVRVALCAGDLGKFWQMDSWLFAHGTGERTVDVAAAAKDVGLPSDALQRCVDDPATQARAAAMAKEARDVGIRATPGYVVDGAVVKPEELGALLDQRL